MVPRRFVRRGASPCGHTSGYSPATAANLGGRVRVQSGGAVVVQSTSIIGVADCEQAGKETRNQGSDPSKTAPLRS